jgi:hypothetical protein
VATVPPDTTIPVDTTEPPAGEKGIKTLPVANENLPPLQRVYSSTVKFGFIKLSIKVTGKQKRTVTAVAIVQIATIASIQTTTTTATASRRRK